MAKMTMRVVLVIVGVLVLVTAADYSVELYRRATLETDLKPVLAPLTPAELMRRCGVPDGRGVKDLVFQDVYYGSSRTMLRFLRYGPGEDWVFTSAHEMRGGNRNFRHDNRRALEVMTCLGPQK